MQEFTVRNRGRTFRFMGELLAFQTSQPRDASDKPNGQRWTETSIYRTTSGRYVAAGVGKSTVPGETDRAWAHVSETAEGVVSSLYLYDDDGVRYLTFVNEQALQEAAVRDPAIDQAFTVERID